MQNFCSAQTRRFAQYTLRTFLVIIEEIIIVRVRGYQPSQAKTLGSFTTLGAGLVLSLQDSPTVKSRSAVLSEWWAFLLTLHRTRGRRKPQELAHPAFKNGTQDGEAEVMSITAQPATYSGESLSCLHLMHLELVVSEPGKPRTAPSCNFVHLHPRARWLAAKDTASAAAFFMALSMSCLTVQTFPKHLVSSDRIGSYTRIE